MAAGWLLSVFSVIQPASATNCTPRKNSCTIIASSSASFLPSTRSPPQLSPKGNPMQSISPGLTARYGHNASGKEADRPCSLRSNVRPFRYFATSCPQIYSGCQITMRSVVTLLKKSHVPT